jgi:hypothetical protein
VAAVVGLHSALKLSLGFEIEPVAAQYRWNRTCGNRINEAGLNYGSIILAKR